MNTLEHYSEHDKGLVPAALGCRPLDTRWNRRRDPLEPPQTQGADKSALNAATDSCQQSF